MILKLPRIKADFSFFLFAALLFLFRDSRTASAFAAVSIFHEAAHLIAAALFRARITGIKLSGHGISITTQKSGVSPLMGSLAILLSGPFANILLYFLLRQKAPETALLSLGAGIYNLLPYSQLDGGAAIDLIITGSIYERPIRCVLKALQTAIILSSAAVVFVYGIKLLPLFFMSMFLTLNDVSGGKS